MEVTDPVIATQAIMKLKPSIVITNLHLHRSKGLVIWWMAIYPFAHRHQELSGREEGRGGINSCNELTLSAVTCKLSKLFVTFREKDKKVLIQTLMRNQQW